jgi:hypothetical protein
MFLFIWFIIDTYIYLNGENSRRETNFHHAL